MTADRAALIDKLDRPVTEVLAYFAGPGGTSTACVDRWHGRDILQHSLYFHDATAWGSTRPSFGGPLWLLPADADAINEVCRRLHEHESFDELLARSVCHTPDSSRPRAGRRPGPAVLPAHQRRATNRISMRSKDAGAVTHGSTSVAVRTYTS